MSVSKSIPAFSVVEPISKALKSAIMDADVETLRVAIFQLCERGESTSVRSTLEKWLVPKKDLNELIALKGDKEGSSSKPIDIPSSPKAHSPQLATCEHCNEDFDLLENEEKACAKHTGMMTLGLFISNIAEQNLNTPTWIRKFGMTTTRTVIGIQMILLTSLVMQEVFFMNVVIDLLLTRDVHQRNTKATAVTYSYRPTAGVKRRLSIQGPEPKVIRLR
ncbi:hypothetical protein HYALB_00003425 [Hymenoscyphus albidus]|uniref:Uncharacterized protein n=1 Tax=Hymenoscyphus albidus TaxID=595503 RepID=A0A9N9L8X7_9HELO|nr:hypothetical protein HYALB_00003425 [Hymenoscyphus albidus]